jgi:capsid protein
MLGWLRRNILQPQKNRTAGRPSRIVRAKYDSAMTSDHNRRHWAHADGLSVNAANSVEVRRILRNRSRYEVANNSYARGITLTLANDVVGTGPRLQMLTADGEANRRIEHEFHRWAKAVNLAEKLRTLRMAQAQDGEAFAILISNPTLPTAIQLDLRLIEADQVATPFRGWNDPRETDGIIFDAAGNPFEYYVLRQHPGENAIGWESDRVPATSVVHLFRADRPGQRRGIPEITSALPLFAMLREYSLATLDAAKAAAYYAGIIYTDAPPSGEADSIEPLDPIELERNTLLTMPGGWRMSQLQAEQPTGTFADFKREILNEIARCLNMPFKKGIREALFLVTTPFLRWVAISGRRTSQAFAGCSAALVPIGIGNSFVTLAGDWVGQLVEGLGNTQTLVWQCRRSNTLSQLCAIF